MTDSDSDSALSRRVVPLRPRTGPATSSATYQAAGTGDGDDDTSSEKSIETPMSTWATRARGRPWFEEEEMVAYEPMRAWGDGHVAGPTGRRTAHGAWDGRCGYQHGQGVTSPGDDGVWAAGEEEAEEEDEEEWGDYGEFADHHFGDGWDEDEDEDEEDEEEEEDDVDEDGDDEHEDIEDSDGVHDGLLCLRPDQGHGAQRSPYTGEPFLVGDVAWGESCRRVGNGGEYVLPGVWTRD